MAALGRRICLFYALNRLSSFKNLRRKGGKFDHRPGRPKVQLRHWRGWTIVSCTFHTAAVIAIEHPNSCLTTGQSSVHALLSQSAAFCCCLGYRNNSEKLKQHPACNTVFTLQTLANSYCRSLIALFLESRISYNPATTIKSVICNQYNNSNDNSIIFSETTRVPNAVERRSGKYCLYIYSTLFTKRNGSTQAERWHCSVPSNQLRPRPCLLWPTEMLVSKAIMNTKILWLLLFTTIQIKFAFLSLTVRFQGYNAPNSIFNTTLHYYYYYYYY